MKRTVIFAVALLLSSVLILAQERYVQTKYFDADGVEYPPSGDAMVKYLNFHGDQKISEKMNWGSVWWRYHHSEDGNSVYFSVATDMVTGKEVWNIDNGTAIVVSPDRSCINYIRYYNGQLQETIVYQKKSLDNIGTMRR